MRASLRLGLVWMALAQAPPALAADYTIRFGEVQGPTGQRAVTATNSIKLCHKDSGYRFGYEIVPGDEAQYEYFTVLYLPAPGIVSFTNAQVSAGGKEIRTTPIKRQGRTVYVLNFDPGDPAGAWKIDVVINGRVAHKTDFNVVPATACP